MLLGAQRFAAWCTKPTATPPPPSTPLLLSFPGAGVLVFWQLGVLKGLGARYDLSSVPLLGSSSGALACAMAKSGADLDLAVNRGLDLLREYGVVNRSWGLFGVLGPLTLQWMRDVLPPGAGARCSGGAVTLLVTTLPLLVTHPVTDFKCDHDLMRVVMASAHIPLVVDWRLWRNCRWRPCLDGGLWWLLRRSTAEYEPGHAQRSLLVTPFEDPRVMKDLHILRRMRPSDLGAAQQLVDMGKEYARVLADKHSSVLDMACGPVPTLLHAHSGRFNTQRQTQ